MNIIMNTEPIKLNSKNEPDYENYVYGYCLCPVPLNYAIRLPKQKDKYLYRFHCMKCGLDGVINRLI